MSESDTTFTRCFIAALIEAGAAPREELAQAERLAADGCEDIVRLLRRLGTVADGAICAALGTVSEAPLINLEANSIDAGFDHGFSLDFMRENAVLPLRRTEAGVEVVMGFPHDIFLRRAIEIAFGAPLIRRTAPLLAIHAEIDRRYGPGDRSELEQIGNEIDSDDAQTLRIAQLRDLASDAPVVRWVAHLIKAAVESRASDIHIEPFEHRVIIRFRIDGVLQIREAPPVGAAAAVVSRIKLLSKLDIAERRLPQDGRIKLRVQGKAVDVRVSSVPTVYGESVVLRLLDKTEARLEFDALGLDPEIASGIMRSLATPHGIFLVTGPTGSGKSTTLYTAMATLNNSTRKIITVEDPVEHQLDGINQIQVKPQIGLTFASALRSIVRQDPDVIMIGEMRDAETAQIAVQSALTGHLVLSTLHTNDAGSSITRLLDMGIEPYLVTSTVIAVQAQRLVRRLCCQCREVDLRLDHPLAKPLAAGAGGERSDALFRASGCSQCAETGYLGRAAVAELMPISDALRHLILGRADGVSIQTAAIGEGMIPLREDSYRKVRRGVTSLDEVYRVLQGAA